MWISVEWKDGKEGLQKRKNKILIEDEMLRL
jgi:hypothetical protein